MSVPNTLGLRGMWLYCNFTFLVADTPWSQGESSYIYSTYYTSLSVIWFGEMFHKHAIFTKPEESENKA